MFYAPILRIVRLHLKKKANEGQRSHAKRNVQLNASEISSTEDCRLLDTKIATKSAHAQNFNSKLPPNFGAIFVSSNLQSSVHNLWVG